MPIYTYRCDCGKTADVLVRGGHEPLSCDEVPELSDGCTCAAGSPTHGKLTKLLSAPYIASGAAAVAGRDCGPGGAPEPGMCGHCGTAPGSCMAES